MKSHEIPWSHVKSHEITMKSHKIPWNPMKSPWNPVKSREVTWNPYFLILWRRNPQPSGSSSLVARLQCRPPGAPAALGSLNGGLMVMKSGKMKSTVYLEDHPTDRNSQWRFPKMGVPLVIIHVNDFFHYKPSSFWVVSPWPMTMETII